MVLLDSLLSGFKDFATTRGFNYHYYLCTSSVGKPTLLLVHGFPSLAVDWHNQINYFKERGYGLIVPDQLGYGGSDKPAEVAAYTHSSLAKDLIEILDHEKATDVVAIGHDWCEYLLLKFHSTDHVGMIKGIEDYKPPCQSICRSFLGLRFPGSGLPSSQRQTVA
jgi:hypothetical protein